MLELEDEAVASRKALAAVRRKLDEETTRRRIENKTNESKLVGTKQLYERQIVRMQTLLERQGRQHEDERVGKLTAELGESEKRQHECLAELDLLRQREAEWNKSKAAVAAADASQVETLQKKNEQLLSAMAEIEGLEAMVSAAVDELAKYNPEIVAKLQRVKQGLAPAHATATAANSVSGPAPRLIVETPA